MSLGVFILSATAPETMVAAVPAKTAWNRKKASIGTPSAAEAAPERNHPDVPTRGPSPPNIMAYPNTKKPSDAKQKSRRFLVSTLAAFLARTRPASTIANPACMKNTRIAASNTQRVSSALKAEAVGVPSWAAITGAATETNRKGMVLTRMLIDSPRYCVRLKLAGTIEPVFSEQMLQTLDLTQERPSNQAGELPHRKSFRKGNVASFKNLSEMRYKQPPCRRTTERD
jgi:hypothetical protein